jgi:hypothetical protein
MAVEILAPSVAVPAVAVAAVPYGWSQLRFRSAERCLRGAVSFAVQVLAVLAEFD